LVAIGLILCMVIVNTLVRRRLPLKTDLTKNQRFTLAPRTREILKSLQQPVHATVFIPAGRSTSKARDLFRLYADASPKFTWTRVDPLVDQKAFLEKQPKLGPDLTAAILEAGDKRQDVSDFSEKAVTSAVLKLTRNTQRKLLFLTGHGEPDVSAAPGGAADPSAGISVVTEDLRSLGWPIEPVDLYRKDAPALDPEQAAVLAIVGPKKELTQIEKERVTAYLDKGGKVLLLLNNQGPAYTDFLAKWGIKTSNDLVVGENQGGLLVVQADRNPHEAVKAAGRVVFPPLHSVSAASPAPAGITVTELLSSGPYARVIENYKGGANVNVEAAKPGPVGLVVMAEKSLGTGDDAKKGRLIVVGGSAWATDQWARMAAMFDNVGLASGLVNYLAQEEALVAIPPKDENTEQAFLTPDQGRLLLLIHFWDFPLLALLLAIVVYIKRR